MHDESRPVGAVYLCDARRETFTASHQTTPKIMNGLQEIKSINAGSNLFKRARAYTHNNPGVGIDQAIAHLVKQDEKAARVAKSLRRK